MKLVADASVVVAACLSGRGLGPLAGHEVLAPPLLWSEVAGHDRR